jgi:tetratricopeptide (TPR) repeat protein
LRGQLAVATASLTRAQTLYDQLGNRLGEANALTELGHVQRLRGEFAAASANLTRAHTLYTQLEDHTGQECSSTELGVVRYLTGDFSAAIDYLTGARSLIMTFGWGRLSQSRLQKLTESSAKSLIEGTADYLDPHGQHNRANALTNLGVVYHAAGNHPVAMTCFTRAHTFSVTIRMDKPKT